MINITGIDDIDRIIYDYKNNMEIWGSLYYFCEYIISLFRIIRFIRPLKHLFLINVEKG